MMKHWMFTVTLISLASITSTTKGCPSLQQYWPCRCENIHHQENSNSNSKDNATTFTVVSAARLNCDHKNLSDDKISRILKVFLANGRLLRTVQLERNGLTRIPDELFLFDGLENVYLSGNKIQSIHRGGLNFSSTLQRLVLNSNSLNHIEPGAFQQRNYGDGSIISFEGNKLTKFEAQVWKSFLELMTSYGGAPYALVELQNNAINCASDPCHLAWLIRDNPSLLKAIRHGTCSNGTSFDELDPLSYGHCTQLTGHSFLNVSTNSSCPAADVITPCTCESYGPNSLFVMLDCNSKNLDDSGVDGILNSFVPHLIDSLRLVSLRDNRLTKVPRKIRLFSQLNRLNLGYNQLTSVKTGDFNFSTRRENVRLWLNHNGITYIQPGALDGIYGRGSRISLKFNKLSRFDSGVFQSPLEQMAPDGDVPNSYIAVGNNLLNCVTHHCHLKWLLSDNSHLLDAIINAPQCWMETVLDNQLDSYFGDCSKYSSTLASGCPVDTSEISPCRCEESESPIETRLICDNQILLGDANAIQVLKVMLTSSHALLTSVQLDSTGLNHVPFELTKFDRLESVHLSGNHIHSIASGSFNFAATLKRLNLSLNGLNHIEPNAFQGNYGEGSWIILSNNNLTSFEADVFQSVLERMEPFIDARVQIDDNPIDCVSDSCHLAWLIRDNPHLLTVVHDGHCSNGTRFAQLRHSGFHHCFLINSTNAERPLAVIVTYWVFVGVILTASVTLLAVFLRKYQLQRRAFHGINDLLFRGNVSLINPKEPLGEQTDFMPYNKLWEFPESRLRLGILKFNRSQLRKGGFSQTVKSEAVGCMNDGSESNSRTVAVKMVLSQMNNTRALESLITELKVLIHLGSHLNVVNLLGACTSKVSRGDLLVMIEYCRFGNLHSYLINNRNNFVKQETDYYNIIRPDLLSQRRSTQSVLYQTGDDIIQLPFEQCSENVTIYTSDLMCWSFQIARGMSYITSKTVVHGNLAACNVYLTENGVVKIANIGLARQFYSQNEEMTNKMTFKWMAIESLNHRIFSVQSDVWSFGVVLWEIFSMCQIPYEDINTTSQLIRQLQTGYRMEKPEFATNAISRIILDCWKTEPSERPTFHQLEEAIGGHLMTSVRDRYIEMNQPFIKLNEEIKKKISMQNNKPPIDLKTRFVRRTTDIFNRSTSTESQTSMSSYESSITSGIVNQAYYESHS